METINVNDWIDLWKSDNNQSDKKLVLYCFLETEDPTCQYMQQILIQVYKVIGSMCRVILVEESYFDDELVLEILKKDVRIRLDSFPAFVLCWFEEPLILRRPGVQDDVLLFGQFNEKQMINIIQFARDWLTRPENKNSTILECDL